MFVHLSYNNVVILKSSVMREVPALSVICVCEKQRDRVEVQRRTTLRYLGVLANLAVNDGHVQWEVPYLCMCARMYVIKTKLNHLLK